MLAAACRSLAISSCPYCNECGGRRIHILIKNCEVTSDTTAAMNEKKERFKRERQNDIIAPFFSISNIIFDGHRWLGPVWTRTKHEAHT